MNALQSTMKKVAESSVFQRFILSTIVFAGVLIGVETDPTILEKHASLIHILDQVIIWIFVAEFLVKILSEGKQPWRYFTDAWNVFDFIIVAACFLPFDAQYVMVLRLARLLRVLKLVRVLPNLQLIVTALLKAIPSMGYVGLLLALLFYVYGVTTTFLFAGNDPMHFGSLGMSILTLFGVVTMEGWVTIMDTNRLGCDVYGYEGFESLCTAPEAFPVAAPVIFISMILLGTMVVLNLFIGVIMNGMQAAREEAELAETERKRELDKDKGPTVSEEMHALIHEMDRMQNTLKRLQVAVELKEKPKA